MKLYLSSIETPIATLILAATEEKLVFVQFATTPQGKVIEWFKGISCDKELRKARNNLLSIVEKELKGYFRKELKYFNVPIDLRGTTFQKRVWRALTKVPYGRTRTYGEIARDMGIPRGGRAIGMACKQNPIAIIIPCHRVVGKNGRLTGYSAGLTIKRRLLELEKNDGVTESTGL